MITVCNPVIKNLLTVTRNNLPILYKDPEMKNIFLEDTIKKSFRELIPPSLFPQAQVESQSIVSKCKSRRCDICQNYLVCNNKFTCTVTGKTYKVRVKLCCTSSNVIYPISRKLCKEQDIGSPFKDNFKSRFRVRKGDVITGKDRCGVTKHFLTKCTDGNNVGNIKVQLIEQVQEGNYDLEAKLWCREKYWRAQLFTLSHGSSITWDWYNTKRKGYRKKEEKTYIISFYCALCQLVLLFRLNLYYLTRLCKNIQSLDLVCVFLQISNYIL